MKNKPKLPLISNDLVVYLDQMFPDKCPELKETEREIFYKAGQRSVVNHLLEKAKFQLEEK
jgi:hypothetical protein